MTQLSRLLTIAATALLVSGSPAAYGQKEILNASYDVSREVFEDVNKAFVPYWKEKRGEDVTVKQSHAGSSKQARAILEGLEADVVTFNQSTDVQILWDDGKLIAEDWRARFPHNASPFYSVTSLLVRKGNPKNIKDWDDLAREGVEPVFPNPKTSGNGRYTVLSLYSYAQIRFGGDEEQSKQFLGRVLRNVPVFDTGGRAATTTFVERGIGDVLVTFESEAAGLKQRYAAEGYELVTPSVSILAEFPVAVVDKVAEKKGTVDLSKGYLDYLYTPQAQEILAKHHNRVRDEAVAAKHPQPSIKLVTVEETFGGWPAALKKLFAQDALVDQLLGEKR